MQSVLNRDVPHVSTEPLLRLSHLTLAYGDAPPVLDDLSLTLAAGERVAVVGPNGAGKSSLFKLIVGELRPNRGTIALFGSDPTQHICIGYVPQRNQIDWSFPVTVEDVVMMGRVGQIGLLRWPRKRDREIVRQSLERVRATHLAHKPIGELSGGQQQRVFIARALAQQAQLLLLDEPFTGLDAPSYTDLRDLLAAVEQEGVTMMVSTHDLTLGGIAFDKVLLLNHRLIVFDEPTRALSAEYLSLAYGMHSIESGGVHP